MIATIGRVMEQPGRVVVETPRPDAQNLSEHVTVLWQDARRISPEQRRKAYALMGEIAAWSGDTPEHVKGALKVDFRAKTMEGMQKQLFSLADCDMSTARDFISFVIDFMLEYDVPSSRPLTEYAEDIEAYVYACLMHRKCAICGKKADVHHWKRLGMGANRREAIHLGMPLEPLCRLHHQECHRMNQSDFDSKYHIIPVTATEQICKRLGLKCNAE